MESEEEFGSEGLLVEMCWHRMHRLTIVVLAQRTAEQDSPLSCLHLNNEQRTRGILLSTELGGCVASRDSIGGLRLSFTTMLFSPSFVIIVDRKGEAGGMLILGTFSSLSEEKSSWLIPSSVSPRVTP